MDLSGIILSFQSYKTSDNTRFKKNIVGL